MGLTRVKGRVWDSSDNVVVPNLTALKALPETAYEGVITVEGHTTVNDGGGGNFIYNPAVDRSFNNNGTIIDPTETLSGFGCWTRIYTNNIGSLSWFGSSDASVSNLLSLYGVDGLIVHITDPSNNGFFQFDSAKVSDPNTPNLINGWVRINDNNFTNNINLHGNKITQSGVATLPDDVPNLDQVEQLVIASDYVGIIPLYEPEVTAGAGQATFATPADGSEPSYLLAAEAFEVNVNGEKIHPDNFTISEVNGDLTFNTPLVGGEQVIIEWFAPIVVSVGSATAVTATISGTTNSLEDWFGERGEDILVRASGAEIHKTLGDRFRDDAIYFGTINAMVSSYGLYSPGAVVITKGAIIAGDGNLNTYFIKTETQAIADGDALNSPNIEIPTIGDTWWAILQVSEPPVINEEILLVSGLVVDFTEDVTIQSIISIFGPNVDGERLLLNGDYVISGPKQITLANSYPASTNISHIAAIPALTSPSGTQNTIQNVTTLTDDVDVTKTIIQVDTATAGGSVTLTFTTAAITTAGLWEVFIKDASDNASIDTITIETENAETIDGDLNYVLNTDSEGVSIYTDGSNLFRK
jgi:hypothetical protein